MISTTSLNQARKEIQRLKKENPKETIIIQGQSPEFNRKILENKDTDILLSPEFHDRKDRQKQRDSGLNEFMCKLAKKNNIKIAINLQEIKSLNKKDKAIILARIKQNIGLCKRTKTQIIFHPQIPKQEATSFLTTLGASTEQTKNFE